MQKVTIPKSHSLRSILTNVFLKLEHTRLLLTPHLPPRIQEWDKTWSDVGEPLSDSQWKETITTLTNKSKKDSSLKIFPKMGFVSLDGVDDLQNIGFCLNSSNNTIYFKSPFAIQKKLSSISNSILHLQSKSSPSFHFFVGPGCSGKSSLMFHRLQKLNEQYKLCISTFSELPQYNLPSKHSLFYHFLLSEIKEPQEPFPSLTPLVEPSSLVIIDAPLEKSLLEQALGLVESGKNLYWIIDSISIESFLRQLYGLLASSPSTFSYLLKLTQNITGQHALFNLKGDLLLAHEILFMNKDVKESILQEKWKKLSLVMEEGEKFKNGMQTLNQSLLKHLVARHLSLKEAFHISTDPENLNQLLDSKGI